MWIARLENGITLTEKDYDYLYLDHSKIVSLQLLFNGRYLTVTRANPTQVLIQEKAGASYVEFGTGKRFPDKIIGKRIYCIQNNLGLAKGWVVDYINNVFHPVEFVALEPRVGLYYWNFELDKVEDGEAILKEYKMKN
jgi:hypothetical protein